MKKFLLSIALISIVSLTSWGRYFFYQGWEYFGDNEQHASIIHGNASGDLVIPTSVVEEYTVQNENGELEKRTQQYVVNKVASRAFENCMGITSINFHDSIIGIAEDAFKDCTSLTSIVIGKSLKLLDRFAFRNCNNLTRCYWNAISCNDSNNTGGILPSTITELTIGPDVEHIPSYFRYEGLNIENLVIPDNVTTIGVRAFSPAKFKSLSIGNGIKVIDSYVFADCDSLKSVVIPNSVVSIKNNAFYSCKTLEDVVIGDAVKSLSSNAFSYCPKMNSLTIGKSVEKIGIAAFKGNTNLKNIYSRILRPEKMTYMGISIFEKVPVSKCALHVPKGTIAVYRACDQWKDFVNIVDDIEVEHLIGDLNNDGLTDVSDVDEEIDMLLGKAMVNNGVADFNGDGLVDVTDVDMLIDIVLGK